MFFHGLNVHCIKSRKNSKIDGSTGIHSVLKHPKHRYIFLYFHPADFDIVRVSDRCYSLFTIGWTYPDFLWPSGRWLTLLYAANNYPNWLGFAQRPMMSICINYIEKVNLYKHFEGHSGKHERIYSGIRRWEPRCKEETGKGVNFATIL